MAMLRSVYVVVWMISLWRLSKSLSSSAGTSIRFDEAIHQASKWLSGAESVLIVTGAGISAESGLPTYRGISGLYNDDQQASDGMTIEQCLSSATYETKPELTWRHLLRIEQACRGAEPSRAHRLIATLEDRVKPGPVTVMTQNVDTLHTRARSTDVLHLHGEIYSLHCTECNRKFQVDSYARYEEEDVFPPSCDKCGGPVRPSVVLFDEYLGDQTVQTYEARLGESMATLSWTMVPKVRKYDVSISIGTSSLFQYVNAAALSGKRTIEINPDVTALTNSVDLRIQAGATEALQAIFNELGWEYE